MMLLAQEETRYGVPCISESLSPHEPTAELGQWHDKYFWNLFRNLNESGWLRVEICFLQSRPQLKKNLWIIWLCVEILLSKCFSKLSLVWFEGSLIAVPGHLSLRPCGHCSWSWSGHSCCHFGSALRPVTCKGRPSLTMPRRSNTSEGGALSKYLLGKWHFRLKCEEWIELAK